MVFVPSIPGLGSIPGLSNLTGGLKTNSAKSLSTGTDVFNDRLNINVAPIGVNVGEIFRNFSGPSENGGFGFSSPSLFSSPSRSSLFGGKTISAGFNAGNSLGAKASLKAPFLLIAVGVSAVFLFFKLRK